MSKQFFFFEKAASHATRSFYLCIDRCENEKCAAPPTFLCWRQLFVLSLQACLNKFFLRRRTFHCTIGAGTFTSKSSFNRKSVQFVTIRVKNIYARTFVTFYFSLGSSIQCLLFVGIRSYSTQDSVCRRMEQMYLSIVEEYFSVLMNNTSPKSFSFDFICFKYCFWFGI